MYQGTWRQYIVLKKWEATVLPDDADLDAVSGSFVNPVTAWGFIDVFQKGGHKAMIHDAACSALGKMLVKLAQKHSVPLINIVRREEQVKILEALGAEYIVNSSLDTFADDLSALISKLNATVFFDAIGGDITGQVLDLMPSKSTVYVYGALSMKNVSYHPGSFIFHEATISYFWLGPWLKSLTDEERKKWIGSIIVDLSSGGKIFGQVVAKTFPLSEFATAMAEANKLASEGKVILKPHES